MDDAQALLTRVYEAYNRRDFSVLITLMAPDIDWPNMVEDGRVVGRDALETYWVENSKTIRVDSAP